LRRLILCGTTDDRLKIRTGSGAETTVSTYNERDQLTKEVITGGNTPGTVNYGYDANGSLTSQTGALTRTQTWDVRGRMSGATVGGVTTSYGYTPDGIRSTVTEGSTTTLYVIDAMSPSGYAQVVEERTSNGLYVASYVYGAGLDPVISNRSGQATGLYFADGHSGVRQVVSLAGVVLQAQRFDAYGATVSANGTFVNPIGYRGERFDATLGQYYLRARFYDPRQGRFTGMDPYMGNMSDPSQVMRYGYAGANPLGKMDPSGRMSIGGMMAGLTIGGGLLGAGIGAAYGGFKGRSFSSAGQGALHGLFTGLAIGGALAGGVLAVWLAAPLIASVSAYLGAGAGAMAFGATGGSFAATFGFGTAVFALAAIELAGLFAVAGSLGTLYLGAMLPALGYFAYQGSALSLALTGRYFNPTVSKTNTYSIPTEYNDIITSTQSFKELASHVRGGGAQIGSWEFKNRPGKADRDLYTALHYVNYETKTENGKFFIRILDDFNFEYHFDYYAGGGGIATAGANIPALLEATGMTSSYPVATSWIAI
jgi:RHS repeat-associated protein